jgi:hypothetical protein
VNRVVKRMDAKKRSARQIHLSGIPTYPQGKAVGHTCCTSLVRSMLLPWQVTRGYKTDEREGTGGRRFRRY